MEKFNVVASGYVEVKDNDAEKFSDENFKKISKGDTVFFGDNEHGIVHDTLSKSVYLEGSRKQIYPSDLRPPYFSKATPPKKETLQEQAAPQEQKLAAVKKPVKTPVNPMMFKLQSLLVRYPQYKAFILKEASSGLNTVEEIEGEILMMGAN